MLTRGNRTDLNLPPLPDALNETEHIALAIEHVQQQQQPPMAAPVEVFKTNPFVGNFNPGTEAGRKIFLEKTRGLDEDNRLDFSKSNSLEIQQYLRGREEHLGEAICSIPIEFNPDGTVKSTANLLTQSHMIKITDLQRAGHAAFGTALAPNDPIPAAPFQLRELDPAAVADDKKTFYKRVNVNVVTRIIKNGLSTTGWNDLMLQKDKFTFVHADGSIEYDGGIMAFLIYQKIEPSTTVGLDSLVEDLQKAKLGNYSNDVDKMLTDMEAKFKILNLNGQAPLNYRKLLLDSLSTGPNHKFNDFIDHINDDVESGIGVNKDIDPDSLIVAVRTKFNNMEKRDQWNKVDPRDAQILVLTTKLEQLEQKSPQRQPKQPAALATYDNVTGPGCIDGTKVKEWRITHDGPSKTVDGKEWFWCPHHVNKGKWDGLYVAHRPEQHKGQKNGTPKKDSLKMKDGLLKPATPVPATQLQLQSRLKEVMCTNLCMSGDDVDKLFDAANSSEN